MYCFFELESYSFKEKASKLIYEFRKNSNTNLLISRHLALITHDATMSRNSSIALSTNDVTNFLVPAVTQTLNLTRVRVNSMGKSRSATNFRRLWRCLSLKETKSSLVSIINILKIINACQDSVKHGKKLYRWVVLFLMQRHNAVG